MHILLYGNHRHSSVKYWHTVWKRPLCAHSMFSGTAWRPKGLATWPRVICRGRVKSLIRVSARITNFSLYFLWIHYGCLLTSDCRDFGMSASEPSLPKGKASCKKIMHAALKRSVWFQNMPFETKKIFFLYVAVKEKDGKAVFYRLFYMAGWL